MKDFIKKIGLLIFSLPISLHGMENINQKIQKISKDLSALQIEHQESRLRQEKIETELQSILKNLSKTKGFNFSKLDALPQQSATLKRVIEQYLYFNDLSKAASPFIKKLITLCVTPETITTKANISTIAISSDDKTVAIGSDKEVILWNALSKNKKAIFNGFKGLVTSLSFGPNGTLAAGDNKGLIIIWDLLTKKQRNFDYNNSYYGSPQVESIAFSSNGKILAAGYENGTIILWNSTNNRLLDENILANTIGAVKSLALNYNHKTLASAAVTNNVEAVVELWDTTSKKIITTQPSHYILAGSSDGKILASAGNEGIKLLDFNTKQEIATLHENDLVRSLAISPDNKFVAAALEFEEVIKIWNIETKQIIAQLTGHTATINMIQFSHDGKTLVSGSNDKTIKFWDVTSWIEIIPFLKSLYKDNQGVSKFLLLNAIFESNDDQDKQGNKKEPKPLKLYEPKAIELLKALPSWLQKKLQDNRLVRVFKK